MKEATFVVVGGGIAGVTCVEYLSFYMPSESIVLISSSPLIKRVTNIVALTKMAYTFRVDEADAETLKEKHQNLEVMYDTMSELLSSEKIIVTKNGLHVKYKYLCICTGGIPKIIPQSVNIQRVLGIRDTGSVKGYKKYLQNARKIIIVGNGGIASELVYETKGVDTIWIIKDKHMSSTFVDPGAAEFFRSSTNFDKKREKSIGSIKRLVFSEEHESLTTEKAAALGPDWLKNMIICGKNENSTLNVLYECEIESIIENDPDDNWPLRVKLSNNQWIECDLIVSATGVTPCSDFKCDAELRLGPDGGIEVDWEMKTSIEDVFAAGDACHAGWVPATHWFQMRLWTQAHQMGAMAAKSMYSKHANEEILQDFCFEMFTHTTKLFGYPMVLLGKFNGQGLGSNYEILIRTTPNLEYIKFVLVENRLQGVILIGETGLEETCENLILNQIDLAPYGDDILNPDIDIEDYFD